MITTLLAVLGLPRTGRARAERENARRVRWRGSDGRWHWHVA